MSNNVRFAKSVAAIVCALALVSSARAADAEKPAPADAKTNVLILVGGHGFDQASFDKFWSGYDDIDSRIWKGSPYTAFEVWTNDSFRRLMAQDIRWASGRLPGAEK
jgi:opacity protein-like surface antigen